MKKILLLSDTHGYLDNDILQYAKKVDEIWHAGDIGSIEVADVLRKYAILRAVYGNIDGGKLRLEFPEWNSFEVEGVKVLMKHIGGYPGRYAKGVTERIKMEKPDLFISGHSHILKVMQDKKNNLLHMNPGAIGKSGFHKQRTMLMFDIDKREIQNLKLIEWPK
jgi:putative phosphoesterase